MAYGNGKKAKEYDRRSIEIGRVDLCSLTDGRPHPLLDLRTQALPLSDAMAQAAWPRDPLMAYPESKEIHRVLLAVQAGSGLNSVWAESRRMVVAPALAEQGKRRRRYLFGLLRHARENTPEDILSAMNAAEAERVFLALEAAPDKELFDTAKHLIGPIVDALATKASAAYPCPSWGRPRAAVKVVLDHRSLRPGGRAGYVGLLTEMTAALHAGRHWSKVLFVSHPVPHSAPVALPVVLSPLACQRVLRGVACANAEIDALTVSITPNEAIISAVLARRKSEEARDARYIVARDFGYRNTAAFAVIDLGKTRNLEDAKKIAAEAVALPSEEAKASCKAWLEDNVAPLDAQVVEAQVWSGARFMERLHVLSKQVDALRSEIDKNYNRVARLKATVNRALGAKPAALVEPDLEGLEASAQRAHTRLFKVLGVVAKLKAKRLALYRKADGVKRSWLGFVSNQEAACAARWGAAVIAEDLDIITPEKESPQYKGRTFNKMINAGCKGRYRKMAAGKLAWLGAPHFVVPSYYTSTTDVRHGVIEKTQRRGECFVSKVDGERMHADMHAATVIGLWPFLVPKPSLSAKELVRKPFFVPNVARAFGKRSPVL